MKTLFVLFLSMGFLFCAIDAAHAQDPTVITPNPIPQHGPGTNYLESNKGNTSNYRTLAEALQIAQDAASMVNDSVETRAASRTRIVDTKNVRVITSPGTRSFSAWQWSWFQLWSRIHHTIYLRGIIRICGNMTQKMVNYTPIHIFWIFAFLHNKFYCQSSVIVENQHLCSVFVSNYNC